MGALHGERRDAERLARDEEFDSLALLVDHFSFMRRYAPTFFETFEFRGAPIAPLLRDAGASFK